MTSKGPLQPKAFCDSMMTCGQLDFESGVSKNACAEHAV